MATATTRARLRSAGQRRLAGFLLLAHGATAHSASSQVAGPPIVANHQPTWTAAQRLRLSASPTMVIGTRSGPAYEFSHIAGAVRLTDGRIAVGDGASAQLRFFDAQGTYLSSIGRRGNGPGELPGLSTMQWLPGDIIAVGSREIVSLFSPAGKLVGRIDLYRPSPPMPEGEKAIMGILPGGTFVAGNIRHWRQTGHAPRTGLRWTDSVHLVALGPSNRLVGTLGDLPARVMEWGKDFDLFSPPQAPTLDYAANAQRFFVGFGSDYTIQVFTVAGRLEFTIRRRWSPTPSGGGQQPGRAPAFDRLLADREGNLWVRDGARTPTPGPTNWSVFSPTGRWLGDVAMPGSFTPTDIGRGYVLGVSRDADDVERVALYRLSP